MWISLEVKLLHSTWIWKRKQQKQENPCRLAFFFLFHPFSWSSMLRNGLNLNGEVNACFLITSYRTSGLHIISITIILMLYAFAFHASDLNEYSISISRYIPFKMRYFLIGLLTIYSIILREIYFSCLIFIWFSRFFCIDSLCTQYRHRNMQYAFQRYLDLTAVSFAIFAFRIAA